MNGNNPIKVIWEGPQLINSSLGLVNRYLCSHLLSFSDIQLKPWPIEKDSIPPSWFPDSEKLKAAYRTDVSFADVHIRQQWPPLFNDFRGSYFVMFQPWEYGTIPDDWVAPINRFVDEVWVNSDYTKKGYVMSGIPTERVFSFPLGFDPDIYHPYGPRLAIKTNKQFKFLFVGGTIFRKGIDKVLDAYVKAFSNTDDVCLVIKDHGGKTHYQGQTQAAKIQSIIDLPNAPEILYMDDDLSPHELATLYRSCNCLVHPYRGEGFGLPILEAMACGIPPIIPDIGPAIEYTTENISFRIPSKVENIKVEGLNTVLPAEAISADTETLSKIMRTVYEKPELTAQKGVNAADYVYEKYTWDKAAEAVMQRIQYLETTTPKYKQHESIDQVFRFISHQFEGSKNDRIQLYSSLLRCFDKGDFIIDLGAGDGTWLRILQDYGIDGIGIDLDLSKVNEMKLAGLKAVQADVIDFSNEFSSQIDGLTMLHIIEHMIPEKAIKLIWGVKRNFTFRGRILIVTPNFENPFVMQKGFWLDVTHIRPYPAELLTTILYALGFKTVVSGTMNNGMDTVVFGSLLINDNPFSN